MTSKNEYTLIRVIDFFYESISDVEKTKKESCFFAKVTTAQRNQRVAIRALIISIQVLAQQPMFVELSNFLKLTPKIALLRLFLDFVV